jgi:ribosomal protein L12E/L44/L45/RPP1/RPP2
MVVQDGLWNRVMQLAEGIAWLDDQLRTHGTEYQIDFEAFKIATGAGVVVTEAMVNESVDKLFDLNMAQILEKKHDFNFATILAKMKDEQKWADFGMVRNIIEAKKLALIGEKPADDGTGKKKKAAKEPKKPAEEKKAEEEPTIDIKSLIGRDVDIGNSAEIL